MNETDLAVKIEMQRQADQAMERVKAMCRRAFEDGVQRGYAAGFEAGVNAGLGTIPKEPDKKFSPA